MLQHATTHHATTCYKLPAHGTPCFNMIQHASSCFNMLHHASTCFKMLQHASACHSMPQHATNCYTLLPPATTCNHLQGPARFALIFSGGHHANFCCPVVAQGLFRTKLFSRLENHFFLLHLRFDVSSKSHFFYQVMIALLFV